ncbi:MAG TPA: hypothetical protein VGL39_04165 [Jatrophihabitantaceae bacterium]
MSWVVPIALSAQTATVLQVADSEERWAAKIVAAIRASATALDDDELAARVGASQPQTITPICQRLEELGILRRIPGAEGTLVNVLTGRHPSEVGPTNPRRIGVADLLSEDTVKTAVKAHLEAHGWSVRVAWGRSHGVDIDAHRAAEHLLLEAKGGAIDPPEQVNYFLGAIGELVQRLRDPGTQYGLALPDNLQYRRLIRRLPALARERIVQVAYLVDPTTATDVVVLD